MTLKELKYYVTSLPKEQEDQEVVFHHLKPGYCTEYEIKGYFKSGDTDNPVIVLTDIEVTPKN